LIKKLDAAAMMDFGDQREARVTPSAPITSSAASTAPQLGRDANARTRRERRSDGDADRRAAG